MPKLYTVKEASDILGLSTNTIYKYVNEGVLKSRRSGDQGRFRIPQDSLEKYLGTPLPASPRLEELSSPTPTSTSTTTSTPLLDQPPLSLRLTRILLIITLVLLLVDLFFGPQFSLLNSILRLSVVVILLLLSYQFGGLRRPQA